MSAPEILCRHCGLSIQFLGTLIRPGLVLVCDHCNGQTIIDLLTPDETNGLEEA